MLTTSLGGDDLDLAQFGLYPEIAGQRVLVTGITGERGIDMVRVFAEHGARLVLQMSETSEATQGLLEMIAPMTLDVEAHVERFEDTSGFVKFARGAVSHYGGIDTVINLIALDAAEGAGTSLAAIERRMSDLFAGPLLLSRVAANRMRLDTHRTMISTSRAPRAMAAHRTARSPRSPRRRSPP